MRIAAARGLTRSAARADRPRDPGTIRQHTPRHPSTHAPPPRVPSPHKARFASVTRRSAALQNAKQAPLNPIVHHIVRMLPAYRCIKPRHHRLGHINQPAVGVEISPHAFGYYN
jgi:hypothetical protein